MPTFDFRFTVNAPLERVARFHSRATALKRLTPPPIFAQLHVVEPLAEGSLARFTLWFGPFPVRWQARHINVSPLHGFTDVQERGPLRAWAHTHRFDTLTPHSTLVHEHIEYRHHPGLRGAFTRLLFSPPGLRLMFTYRMLATRWGLRAEDRHA